MEAKDLDLNKYVTWIQEGKSFSDVRQDLSSLGTSDEDIKGIIIKIDDLLLEQAMNADQGFSAKKSDMIGKIMMGVGTLFLVVFALTHSYTILGIGGALVSAGFTFLLFAKKLIKGNGSVFEKSNKRKLNLRRRES